MDTLPPPASGDAYSAATVVKKASPELIAALRREREGRLLERAPIDSGIRPIAHDGELQSGEVEVVPLPALGRIQESGERRVESAPVASTPMNSGPVAWSPMSSAASAVDGVREAPPDMHLIRLQPPPRHAPQRDADGTVQLAIAVAMLVMSIVFAIYELT